VSCGESGGQNLFALAVNQARCGFEIFNSCEEIVEMSEGKRTLRFFKNVSIKHRVRGTK
jgi:hypothetical protein